MSRLLLIAALLAASPALRAQEFVADMGSLEALHFEGAKSFTPEALRKGLQSDLDFLLAAHPAASLHDYLRTIKKRLTEGYLRAGFPEVVVSTTDTDNGTDTGRRIVVKISEGPRFMCGDIRVTGARKVPADFFVRHLKKIGALSPTNDSGIRWTNSVGAPFSGTTLWFISRYATNAFLNHGFAAPRFEVKLTPDPRRGVADLILDIKDEGPKTFIGEIDILGAHTNSTESIIRYLGLKTGQPVQGDLPEALNARLRESGRFLKHVVRLLPPDQSGRALLEIELKELETAPPLEQELTREQRIFLRARDWIASNAVVREDLVVEFALDDFHPRLAGIGIEAVLGAPGVLVNFNKTTGPLSPAQRLQYSVRMGTNAFVVLSPLRERKLVGSRSSGGVSAFIEMEPKPDGDEGEGPFNFTMGGGYTAGKEESQPMEVRLSLAPSAFLNMARQAEGEMSISDGVLNVTNDTGRFRIDVASGRPLALVFNDSNMVCRFSAGAFNEAAQRLDALAASWPDDWKSSNAFVSTALFAMQELLSHARGSTMSGSVRYEVKEKGSQTLVDQRLVTSATTGTTNTLQWLEAMAVLNRFPWQEVLAPLSFLTETNEIPPEKRFSVPADLNTIQSAGMAGMVAFWTIPISDRVFDWGSWPWSFVREGAFMAAGKGRYTDKEMERIYQSRSTGPIACLTAASLLKQVNPDASRNFAIAGLARLSHGFFLRDCAAFLDTDAAVGQMARRTLEAISKLDEKDAAALGAALGPEGSELVTSLRRLYRGRKNEPVTEALAPALEVYWDKTLKEKVARSLRGLRTLARRPMGSPTSVAALEGRAPGARLYH